MLGYNCKYFQKLSKDRAFSFNELRVIQCSDDVVVCYIPRELCNQTKIFEFGRNLSQPPFQNKLKTQMLKLKSAFDFLQVFSVQN